MNQLSAPNPMQPLIPYGSLVCNIYLSGGQAPTPTGISGLDGTRDPLQIARHFRAGGASLLFVDVRDSWDQAADSLCRIEGLADLGLTLWVSVEHGVIRTSEEVHRLLQSGAAAVSVNTTAVDDPAIVEEVVAEVGSSRLIGVLNAQDDGSGSWRVCVDGGQRQTNLNAIRWARRMVGSPGTELEFAL